MIEVDGDTFVKEGTISTIRFEHSGKIHWVIITFIGGDSISRTISTKQMNNLKKKLRDGNKSRESNL